MLTFLLFQIPHQKLVGGQHFTSHILIGTTLKNKYFKVWLANYTRSYSTHWLNHGHSYMSYGTAVYKWDDDLSVSKPV
jgi:hypothetical protein